MAGSSIDPNTGETRPAIIVLHGWQSAGTNGASVVEPRARRFAEQGYVALALSMRGWPPSGGADDCGLRQPDDVAAAAAWLRTQPGVMADRIAIVGFSQADRSRWRSPLLRARDITAPVLLIHGDADLRVPTEQSQLMHDALIATGHSSELVLIPGAQHGFTAAEEAIAGPRADTFLSSRLR